MRSDQLTGDQLEALGDKIRPMLRETRALVAKLEKAGLEPGDELLVLTTRAADALQHLHVELHYLGCGGQVGRPQMKEAR